MKTYFKLSVKFVEENPVLIAHIKMGEEILMLFLGDSAFVLKVESKKTFKKNLQNIRRDGVEKKGSQRSYPEFIFTPISEEEFYAPLVSRLEKQ